MPAVWTTREAQAADQSTAARGVEGATLLEAAGAAVAREVALRGAASVLVLAGPGKNGGDGLVAARRLAARGVVVWIYTGAVSAPELLRAAEAFGAERVDRLDEVLPQADLVVDAIFGTGLSRPLEEPWVSAVARVAESGKPVLAVDLPSGVDADTGALLGPEVAPAAITVTFQALKPGHVLDPGASLAGPVKVADIGLPEHAGSLMTLIDPAEFPWKSLERDPDAHKYASGRVLIIGGSPAYAGAPGLAGLGALRSGTGYVELYVPRDIVGGLRTLATLPLVVRGGDIRSGTLQLSPLLRERMEAARAVVVGPGMEATPELLEAVMSLRRPVVVDAGAFSSWHALGRPEWTEAVFTPHAGEMARLLDVDTKWVDAHRVAAVQRLADLTGGVAVLKGRRTLVAGSEGPVAVNLAGGPELATMGTGDVLAGVMASILARGWPGGDAARAAVLWHGMAGHVAGVARGPFSVTATDVADCLGTAFQGLLAGDRPAEWPGVCL